VEKSYQEEEGGKGHVKGVYQEEEGGKGHVKGVRPDYG